VLCRGGSSRLTCLDGAGVAVRRGRRLISGLSGLFFDAQRNGLFKSGPVGAPRPSIEADVWAAGLPFRLFLCTVAWKQPSPS
jgi:hypothetical protein